MAGPVTKMVIGAAKAGAEPCVEVFSLMGALEDILEVPVGKSTVKVRALKLRHAAALAEMLHFQTSRRRWEIKEFRKLKLFGSADAILVIHDDVLLPILAKDPTFARALDLLERYGNRLHTLSVSIGGTLEEEIDFVHEDVISYVNEARAEPPVLSPSELIARSTTIRTRIKTLRTLVVGIGDHSLSDRDDTSDEGDD